LPSTPHSPDSVKQTKAFHSGRAARSSYQSRKQIFPKDWKPQRLCKWGGNCTQEPSFSWMESCPHAVCTWIESADLAKL